MFSTLTLPSMPPSLRDLLESAVTPDEVAAVIKCLKPYKKPDGFSACFYKKFIGLVAPLLSAAFNVILGGKNFPPQSLQSYVCMIPKPQTDTTHWSNFCPISLINVELKILTKVLATRLNSGIGALVNYGQMGFMLNRQAYSIIFERLCI